MRVRCPRRAAEPRTPPRAGAAGFTLIEMLAVMLILAILVGVLVVQLRDTEGAARVQIAKQLLAKVESTVRNYQNDNGSAPSSSFQPAQEVANDGLNVGNEALVVALWSKKYEAGGLLADLRDGLVNTDGDRSPKQLTDFDTRELLEIPDPWDNPIAYIERADYDETSRRYLTLDGETGEQVESIPLAFKNASTGQFYSAQGFQLISAGPDGRFGTEDDITPFERK
jgi:prepilin-type N-terminal cleavage/methylation domain-containing protein